MKISINEEACMGHGRCYGLAPRVFDSDEMGHAVLLVAEVAASDEAGAAEAARACPERAIAVTVSA